MKILYIPEDLHKRLKKFAKIDGRHMYKIVVTAITEYLDKNEKGKSNG